ncbi:amidophosphoribosyltransferase [Gordonia amicalis]|uniref:amidophosphoribosyltransferase n=1 Tax=Gordonia amicalis TaxID=89053 RepID=UPI0002A647A1|nr:amidophosphoribosyltransferase [Gordonia amicalis]MBA5848957.1 amidophosphoribosyltransferase [Gordonia amicalis]MDV7100459.1 amidophosphoribosyltransferase [Gordonia amicalis]MDV7174195.1 amidophosphoribosyltransferase [Gordonia amicalis]NKX77849.1 amidophosphoribosyltransferase [Gordonia amicalis]UOG20800.1 amidophosphoribosyltransferase [Gordonia amicalis]
MTDHPIANVNLLAPTPAGGCAAAGACAPGPAPSDQPENEPREECGVFGVWAPGEDVAKLTYYGLYALQHRGQEAAGIAVGDGSQVVVFKDLGLVSQVFDEQTLGAMSGHVAIGHCRYSTTGSTTWENSQPIFRTTDAGTGVALGHNGNLVNTADLAARAREKGIKSSAATSDSDVVGALLAHGAADSSIEQAAMELLPTLKGAFCLTFMDEHTLYAARDPHGVRPLSLGRLDRGWVVASETAALDIVGASFVRDIEPGELLAIDADGVRTKRFAEPTPRGCVFEYVYLARPDSNIHGRSVHSTRVEIGRRLAKEHPAEGDLVIPVPESGVPAAVGFAQGSGIPYGQGLMKNAYVGRTFIQPSQTIRQLGIRLKLNPLREVIRGKRLVVVDDSIVRGNTQRALIRMLREAGAAEVHVRIASSPVRWPCFYGIDFASPAELIANGMESEEGMVEGVRQAIGADSLGYISIDEMIGATEQPASSLCAACFDGNYPIELPEETSMGKAVLEQMLASAAHDGTVDPLTKPNDNVSAVMRP